MGHTVLFLSQIMSFLEISVTKPERTIPPIPQRIAANRNDEQDQHCYNNKTSRCRKSFIQSRAKSLTSLKNESKDFLKIFKFQNKLLDF